MIDIEALLGKDFERYIKNSSIEELDEALKSTENNLRDFWDILEPASAYTEVSDSWEAYVVRPASEHISEALAAGWPEMVLAGETEEMRPCGGYSISPESDPLHEYLFLGSEYLEKSGILEKKSRVWTNEELLPSDEILVIEDEDGKPRVKFSKILSSNYDYARAA